MTTDDNVRAISYHSRHAVLSVMYALVEETFITDPEIVISVSGSDKKTRLCVFSRDEGSLPDKTEWERIENDENIEAFTMVASTDPEDERRFTVMYLPQMENVLALNFVSGIAEEEEKVIDSLLNT